MSTGARPPDANGAVGPNNFVQTVNASGSSFEVWDKNGGHLSGPTSFGTLWSAAPGDDDCKNRGRGDPYVLYDHLKDRWVLSQLANHLALCKVSTEPSDCSNDPLQAWCIAVSQTSDPTGAWYAYTFFVGVSNDYVKLGLWPDGYYGISQRGYDGTSSLDAWVFDRANMLNGNPATFQHPSGFPAEHDVIALPGELTGPAPPAGSNNYYARPYDGTLYSDGSPRLEIFEFHTDWGVPANTTFGLKQTLTPATFSSNLCAGISLNQNCVPQPNETNKLDGLSTWPMGPLQYRNFGSYETLVFNHSVNVDGKGLAGVRWYELRRTPPGSGSWVIQQQGTFSPTDSPTSSVDSIHRWGGSIAMDQAGDMAVGFSASNDGVAPHPVVYPSARYVGRLATDPPGEMTTPEVTLVAGTASQPADVPSDAFDGRWGDYSAIRVDPADGCTFWFTTEYVASTNTRNTRFGAFRFPTCNPANLSIIKTASPNPVTAGSQLDYTFNVKNNGPATATNVVVTDTLPASTVFLSSSVPCTGVLPLRTCNLGTLASGASTFFTIQVKVASSASSAIVNTATVAADQLDPDLSDNTSTVTTNVVQSADLSVTKTCKPDTTPALAGTTAFCTMVVTNNGPSDASGVSLTDTIVASTPFTIGTVTKTQGTCSATAGTITSGSVTCSLGTIAAGSAATVTVNFSAQSGGTIEDTVSVTSTTPDPTTPDTASGAVTYISSADLSITKTALPNPNVVAGTNLTYTITASNAAGPSTATNVVVKDTLPGQVSVVSVTPSVGTCSGGIPGNPAQPLICTLGSLIKGASASITVVVTVNPNTPNGTILTNNASISSDTSDPNNNNNTASVNETVVAQADLAIVKTSDKPIYKPTSIITYTIKVTNNGPSDSQAVIVTDNLPAIKQAHYQSDTGGCTLTLATNVLTCNLGTMPTGTTKSFDIYELIVGNKGTITNTASVTSSTTDPNAANNTSTRIVGVK